MASLHFDTSIETSKMMSGLREIQNGIHKTASVAKGEGEEIQKVFDRIKTMAAASLTAFSAKEFISNVATVRGQFQQLEMAFKTMLGSAEQADALMSQLINTAATTPFGMSDVANGAKQLLAYGLEADKVNDTLIRLGDIAAGLSIPLNDLTYLYGTTMVQGRMYTQDLNQFLGRGIPLTEELAKQFGVAQSEVKELVTQGKVGFPEVEKAIISLTSEGSKFGGLMDAQSKTITGQISNIEDSIEQMFNEIGKQTEGVISDTLSVTSKVIDHWEEIGKVLLTVISMYGAYKAAVLTVAAAHKIAAIAGQVQAFLSLTRSITSAKDAMLLFNMATKANPIGLLVSAVAAVASYFVFFKDNADDATDAIEEQKKAVEDFNKTVGDAASESISKYKQLQEEYANCKTAHEKREWIKNTQKRFDELGISVGDVNTAENIFVKNTELMMSAFKKRAEAAAWQTKLNDAYSQRVTRQMELERQQSEIYAGAKVQGQHSHTTEGGLEYVAGNGEWVYTEKGAKAAQKALMENDATLKSIDEQIDTYAQKVGDVQADFNNLLKGAGTSKATTSDKVSSQSATDAKKQADERKKLQEQLAKDLQAIQQRNEDDEIALMQEGTDKKLAEIRNSYKKQIAEIDRQEQEFKKKNKEAGVKTAADGLTSEQSSALGIARANAAKESERSVADLYKEQLKEQEQSMQDYLKAYGDYEQQRLAVTKEYEGKIAEAKTEGERLSLRAQMKDALKGIDTEEMSKSVDWEGIFNNLSYMTVEQLNAVKRQLRGKMADSSLGVDEYKTAAEQIGKVNEAILTAQDKTKEALGLVLPTLQERKRLEMDVAEAEETQRTALEAQAKAAERLSSVRGNLSNRLQDAGLDIGKDGVTSANSQAILDEISGLFGSGSGLYKDVEKALGELADSERGVTEANDKAATATNDLANAAQRLKIFTEDFSNKLKGVMDVMSVVNSNMQSLPDLFSNLGINMDGAFGKGIQDLANASSQATSALSDFASGNFVGAAANGIGAVRSLWSGVGNLLTGSGFNEKAYAERMERLTASNEALQKSIDSLADKMDDATSMSDITDAYKQQIENLRRSEENTQEMMYTSAGAHVKKNMFRSGKKSAFVKVNANTTDAQWATVSDIVGQSIDDARDFFNLTSEQMAKVAEQAPEIYANIKYWASQGYKDAGQYMDEYISYGEQLEELTAKYKEAMTGVSLDSVQDEFSSLLTDMESDTEDFADNFEDTMRTAIINSMMVSAYKKRLEDWYNKFTDAVAGDGKLDDGELSSLRTEYDQIVADALAERNELTKALGGSSSSQEATSGGWQSMGQDTADELNGRFTALQIAGETIASGVTGMLAQIEGITSASIQTNGTVLEMRNMMVMTNSYLEDMVRYAKATYTDFGDKLDNIHKRLKEL